jgi:hypothetical protein
MSSNFWKCAACGQSNPAIVNECQVCTPAKAKRRQVDQAYRLCVKSTSAVVDNDDTLRGFILGFRCYERFAHAFGVMLTPEQIDQIKGIK